MKSTTGNAFRFLFIAMLIATLLGSAMTVTPARAASITVNSNADIVANDGACTLREAITAANTDTASGIAVGECPAGSAGADTITFAGNYTITLGGTQLPVVTTQITINGNGTTNTDIRANASPNVATSRVFEVDATGNLTLSDLTVQNGRCAATCATYPNNGGGIANAGTLTITFSRLESNSVTQDGGGIFNAGTLTVTNSTFVSNTSSNNGGGIYNNDTLTVTNSTFNTNTAGDSGGGIFNGGFAMSITNSQFTQNSSSSGGGSIYNSSSNMDTVSITSSTFNNNSSNAGGGIYNVVGNLSISASSFSGNSASTTLSGGGGIYNGYGMTITNSTISGNQSLADNGGGITNDGTLTITGSTIFNNQAFYNGGGIYNGTGSTLFLENSFISNNSAANTSGGGGGIMNGGGTMNVTNSTFSSNSSTDDGAGIYNNNGTATVTNSTISGNSANSNGGGIYVGTGNFNLRNTIIANSVNGGDCVGSFASTSNNLIENASSACGLINGVNGNIIGSDPNLGAITGSPEYFPLNTGSLAIDAGDNAICAAVPVNNTSQNGITRPKDGNSDTVATCDIGAFERDSLPTSATFGDVPMNHPYWLDIEILYANGFTGGCSASPLLFCPETTMDRAQGAVFMLRGLVGTSYIPPVEPFANPFGDSWAPGPWAQRWAQGMLDEGLTAGCSTSPLLYCPWEQMPRAQAAVFGMRLLNGSAYLPPAGTGAVLADINGSEWYAGWVEQAYLNGLLPACGMQGSTPLFCPNSLVSRGLGAYMIVRARNLSMP